MDAKNQGENTLSHDEILTFSCNVKYTPIKYPNCYHEAPNFELILFRMDGSIPHWEVSNIAQFSRSSFVYYPSWRRVGSHGWLLVQERCCTVALTWLPKGKEMQFGVGY